MNFSAVPTGDIDFATLAAKIDPAVTLALEDAARKVADNAKTLAAPMRKTGKLEGSIGSRVQGLSATVFVTAFYGRFMEYGTKFIRARPFMRPALYGARGEIAALLRAAVGSAIGLDVTVAAHSGKKAAAQTVAQPVPPAPDKQQPAQRRPHTREEYRAFGHRMKELRKQKTGD